MKGKSDIVVLVITEDGELFKGRYKWPKSISQDAALRIVLAQFSTDELDSIVSVTFDPVVPINKWLAQKKVLVFQRDMGATDSAAARKDSGKTDL